MKIVIHGVIDSQFLSELRDEFEDADFVLTEDLESLQLHLKNAEVLYNAQPNKGAVLKGFETQPLNQPGAIRDQKLDDARKRLLENK